MPEEEVGNDLSDTTFVGCTASDLRPVPPKAVRQIPCPGLNCILLQTVPRVGRVQRLFRSPDVLGILRILRIRGLRLDRVFRLVQFNWLTLLPKERVSRFVSRLPLVM